MFQIDHPTARGGLFTSGHPRSGIPATIVTAEWLNTVQQELVNLIRAAGLKLNKEDDTQLLQAIHASASLQAYQREGIATAVRTLSSKVSDVASVLDWADVDPNGIQDSSAGLQHAFHEQFLIIPPGRYLSSKTIIPSSSMTLLSFGRIIHNPSFGLSGRDWSTRDTGAFAIDFKDTDNAVLIGLRLTSAGFGIRFSLATAGSNATCTNNLLIAPDVIGPGRPVIQDKNEHVGIFFAGGDHGDVVHPIYFNKIIGGRVRNFNRITVFDATTGQPDSGANANELISVQREGFWTDVVFRSYGCSVRHGWLNGAANSVGAVMQNGAYANIYELPVGEPGGLSVPYELDPTTHDNRVIIPPYLNFAKSGIDDGINDTPAAHSRQFGRLEENHYYRVQLLKVQPRDVGVIHELHYHSTTDAASSGASGNISFSMVVDRSGMPAISLAENSFRSFGSAYTKFVGFEAETGYLNAIFKMNDNGTSINSGKLTIWLDNATRSVPKIITDLGIKPDIRYLNTPFTLGSGVSITDAGLDIDLTHSIMRSRTSSDNTRNHRTATIAAGRSGVISIDDAVPDNFHGQMVVAIYDDHDKSVLAAQPFFLSRGFGLQATSQALANQNCRAGSVSIINAMPSGENGQDLQISIANIKLEMVVISAAASCTGVR